MGLTVNLNGTACVFQARRKSESILPKLRNKQNKTSPLTYIHPGSHLISLQAIPEARDRDNEQFLVLSIFGTPPI